MNSYIYTKKKNTSFREIPFKILRNPSGESKYLPPVAKEWKNSVYNYNLNNIKNYPVYDWNINYLINSYFNLYFNHKFLVDNYIKPKNGLESFNQIFVSNAQMKHTNSKVVITLYVYNEEKIQLLTGIYNLEYEFTVLLFWLRKKAKAKLTKFMSLPFIKRSKNVSKNSSILWKLVNTRLEERYISFFWVSDIIDTLYTILVNIRRFKLRLSLNQYKYESKFLYELSQLIGKYYRKKVEFHIVNIKSIANNADIFTKILTRKLKITKGSPKFGMSVFLHNVRLTKDPVRWFRSFKKTKKTVNYNLVGNKYKYLNISSIIYKNNLLKDNLNKLIYDLDKVNENVNNFDSNEFSWLKIKNILFENIKYKILRGIRVIIKGRLTKRYRADRAAYKLDWIGGLKNKDSAFKRVPSVIFRGDTDSNVEKSKFTSKRRIGSFGVKTWFSGR